jgi:hypothetical protein
MRIIDGDTGHFRASLGGAVFEVVAFDDDGALQRAEKALVFSRDGALG